MGLGDQLGQARLLADVRAAALIASTTACWTSTAMTCQPWIGELGGKRQAHLAGPDDGHASPPCPGSPVHGEASTRRLVAAGVDRQRRSSRRAGSAGGRAGDDRHAARPRWPSVGQVDRPAPSAAARRSAWRWRRPTGRPRRRRPAGRRRGRRRGTRRAPRRAARRSRPAARRSRPRTSARSRRSGAGSSCRSRG